MNSGQDEWMKPEEALSRYKRKSLYLETKEDGVYQGAVARYGYIVKDMGFMISKNTLCEVVKFPEIYHLPNTKKWLCGLVNIRGNLVPVFDFSLLIGVTNEPASYENLLVLGSGERAIGVLIDAVPIMCDIENIKEIKKIKNRMNGLEEYVEKTYIDNKNGIVWMDINERKYFESVKDEVCV